MNSITSTVKFANDEEIVTSTRKKHMYDIPPYSCWGEAGENRNGTSGEDFIEIMNHLSEPALKFFFNLMEEYDVSNNMCVYPYSQQTPYRKKKLSKFYQELRRFKVVKRIKTDHYLINPEIKRPIFKEYIHVLQRWKSTK